jgi:HTH-type transcriptional regulator / antitoxin HigA
LEQQPYHYAPDYAAHPGMLVQEYLDMLGISARELARRCGRSAKLISELIAGKAPLEPETALQLETVLELDAQVWLNMEALYRLHLARIEETQRLATHFAWVQRFPLSELEKRGYFIRSDTPADQVRALLKFFGVASIEACEERLRELGMVAYRHSPSFSSDEAALLAWLRIGEVRAEKVETAEYSRSQFLHMLKQIRLLTTLKIEEFLPKLMESCSSAGVVFLLEQPLTKVALSGISRWLTPRKALIQQTLRHKSNDHFWFTFFHECAHIILHSRKFIFVDGKDIATASFEEEAEANDWAADFLIPQVAMTRFITRFGHTEAEIRAFATEHKVAPGIVVGQLQYRKVLGYHQFNHLKDRYTWTK